MNELLTVREVAAQLRVKPDTVSRYIREGRLCALCFDGGQRHKTYRIRPAAVDSFLRQTQGAANG